MKNSFYFKTKILLIFIALHLIGCKKEKVPYGTVDPNKYYSGFRILKSYDKEENVPLNIKIRATSVDQIIPPAPEYDERYSMVVKLYNKLDGSFHSEHATFIKYGKVSIIPIDILKQNREYYYTVSLYNKHIYSDTHVPTVDLPKKYSFKTRPLEGIKMVKDIDGNNYETVTIKNQEWFVDPLKTVHYSNGDPIESFRKNGNSVSYLYIKVNPVESQKKTIA